MTDSASGTSFYEPSHHTNSRPLCRPQGISPVLPDMDYLTQQKCKRLQNQMELIYSNCQCLLTSNCSLLLPTVSVQSSFCQSLHGWTCFFLHVRLGYLVEDRLHVSTLTGTIARNQIEKKTTTMLGCVGWIIFNNHLKSKKLKVVWSNSNGTFAYICIHLPAFQTRPQTRPVPKYLAFNRSTCHQFETL